MTTLPSGSFVASLYGWEDEPASARRHVRVEIKRDGQPFSATIFSLNGSALPRLHMSLPAGSPEAARHRATQAVTMVIRAHVQRALEDGESLPERVEVSEDEILAAIGYMKRPDNLDVSLDHDSVLWEQVID